MTKIIGKKFHQRLKIIIFPFRWNIETNKKIGDQGYIFALFSREGLDFGVSLTLKALFKDFQTILMKAGSKILGKVKIIGIKFFSHIISNI
jgi:hypothetical protein